MTAGEHNKYLSLAHLAHAGLYVLLMTFMLFIFGLVIFAAPTSDPNAPPDIIFFMMAAFAAVMFLMFALPSLFAAYGLWKRKTWAKTMGIVAGVLAASNFPVGTAVCVYTFWFLFSDPGRELYDTPKKALPPPPTFWAAADANSRTADYARRTPPDWR